MFDTYEDFLRWKSSEEESTNSNYVLHGGSSVKNSIKYNYFYCNRSGISKEKGTGTRCTKMQKSCKIGATCTAHIIVEGSVATGSCKVSYCYTHVAIKRSWHTFVCLTALGQRLLPSFKLVCHQKKSWMKFVMCLYLMALNVSI